MKKLLLLTFATMLLPMTASAQWDFVSDFPTIADLQFSSTHGIAVDPDGKIWVQPFSSTDSVEVNGAFELTNVIYVFNSDGTESDLSPIKFLDFSGAEQDTLGGFINADGGWETRSGRGLRTDADGNILASQFKTIFKIDYQTGDGLAKNEFDDYCALSAPAADANGNVFVASVCSVDGVPLRILDTDLSFIANAVDVVPGFSRSFEVSSDGNRIYWAGYTTNGVILYERPDEFSAFDSVGVVVPGVDSESLSFNSATGNLWVSSGSSNDVPNDLEGFDTNWRSNTWYEFDPASLAVNTVPPFLNFITWNECETFDENGVCQESAGRPRGLAFSPDGEMAYVTQFSQDAPSVQAFTEAPFVAIERDDDTVPESFTLSQNYPNPFNPETRIQFTLKQAGQARLRVFDMLGREVDVLVNETLTPGTYTATFEAQGLASGTYLYMLEFGDQRLSGTMTLLK
ncbi:MAG TPA: T9SS type A sorting domain-containing protein [Rhodothermales bacterium]|nr:T9SS type A sorting domain-containing protein [Rhodothermales bacterium]